MTFKVKSAYTFDTNAPAILGSQFINATMVGQLSYELAMSRENVGLLYRQIFPALPPGTPDDPENAVYYVFKTESGPYVVLCEQWINMDTVVEVSGVDFTVSFVNVPLGYITQVRQLLTAAGKVNFTIK